MQKRLRTFFTYLLFFNLLLLIVNMAFLMRGERGSEGLIVGNLSGISLCAAYLPRQMWLRWILIISTFVLVGINFWIKAGRS